MRGLGFLKRLRYGCILSWFVRVLKAFSCGQVDGAWTYTHFEWFCQC